MVHSPMPRFGKRAAQTWAAQRFRGSVAEAAVVATFARTSLGGGRRSRARPSRRVGIATFVRTCWGWQRTAASNHVRKNVSGAGARDGAADIEPSKPKRSGIETQRKWPQATEAQRRCTQSNGRSQIAPAPAGPAGCAPRCGAVTTFARTCWGRERGTEPEGRRLVALSPQGSGMTAEKSFVIRSGSTPGRRHRPNHANTPPKSMTPSRETQRMFLRKPRQTAFAISARSVSLLSRAKQRTSRL
jgi:hypothetical protein